VGSYNGTAAIYDETTHDVLLELPCQANGVTQVKFSANGAYLFVAGRQSDSILCWDVRMTRSVVSTLTRKANTNQRIAFDVEPMGRHLLTGSRDNRAIVYDLNTAREVTSVTGFADAVNGVSVHPLGTCVAFTTGQRHFPLPCSGADDSDSDSHSDDDSSRPLPTLSIWKCEK
jgi:telomerase Cajal body protein 1